jgi:hypothetical protein
MQVVGAVGFNHKRLGLPEDLPPDLAKLILSCWEEQPSLRPSFKNILRCAHMCVCAYVRAHRCPHMCVCAYVRAHKCAHRCVCAYVHAH